MSTSSSDTVFALGSTTIYVAPGSTVATYFVQHAGQVSTLFKNGAGGTLWIVGCPTGSTLAASDLASATGHYLVGASEVLSFDGPVTCYLANSHSATHTVYCLIGKSAGY